MATIASRPSSLLGPPTPLSPPTLPYDKTPRTSAPQPSKPALPKPPAPTEPSQPHPPQMRERSTHSDSSSSPPAAAAPTPASTPSLSDILSQFRSNGNGDRELLLGLLGAKAAEEQRLAALDNLRVEILRTETLFRQMDMERMRLARAEELERLAAWGWPHALPPPHSPASSKRKRDNSDDSASDSATLPPLSPSFVQSGFPPFPPLPPMAYHPMDKNDHYAVMQRLRSHSISRLHNQNLPQPPSQPTLAPSSSFAVPQSPAPSSAPPLGVRKPSTSSSAGRQSPRGIGMLLDEGREGPVKRKKARTESDASASASAAESIAGGEESLEAC